MKADTVLRGLSLGVITAGLISTTFLCGVLVKRERGEVQQRTEAEAQHAASQFENGITGIVEPLSGIGAWWIAQGPPLEPEDWDSDAQLFLARAGGLRELYWLNLKAIERWSVAPGTRPNAISVAAPPQIRELTEAARRGKSPVFSRIFDFPDGAAGLYACLPVKSQGRLRGFVVAAFDAVNLVKTLPQSRLPAGYDVTIVADGREIYRSGNGGSRPEPAYQAEVHLFNRVWTVTVGVSPTYFLKFKSRVIGIGALFTGLLYACAVLLHLAHRRAAALQRANEALEREMSERRRMEAAVTGLNRELDRKVADFETLVEVIPIGIAVAYDPECRSIWINPALARMMGVPQTTNISLTGPDAAALPYRVRQNGIDVPPEDLPMQRAGATGEEVIGTEHEIVRADGQVIDILSFVSPVFDESGKVRGVLNACVDITERNIKEQERTELLEREHAARVDAEQALAALHASEARFERLIESDVIGILVFGERRILDANQFFCEMIGYSRDELLALADYRDHLAVSGDAADDARLAELLATGKLPAYERELLHRSGRKVPVLIGGTLLAGAPDWKAICFVVDLTLRRDLEARLQSAQRMRSLGVMAGGLAHSFNNLLTTIVGNTSLAMDIVGASHPARANLAASADAAHRAGKLMHEVLAYTGNAYHQLAPVNLTDLLITMRGPLVRLARGKADIRFGFNNAVPDVKVDPEEIRHVITNLVMNAVEAMESRHGSIEVSVAGCTVTGADLDDMVPEHDVAPGEFVRVEVQDTGCGMPPEVAARAFEPFFTTKFIGRGLGLSAAQGIMRAHHGAIRVESSPDSGTRLQLYFPVKPNHTAAPGPSLLENGLSGNYPSDYQCTK